MGAETSARVMQALQECGCALNNGYMQLNLLALAVTPELRVTDLGLIGISRFTHIPVIHSNSCLHFGACRAPRQHRRMLESQRGTQGGNDGEV